MVRYLRHLIIGFLLFGVCQGDASLQRKKRWLVFPKGSSLQLVYCFLVSTFGTRDGIFVIGITVGLAWEIPQNFRSFLIKEAKEKIESRHRRELYSKIRLLLDRLPDLEEDSEDYEEHMRYKSAELNFEKCDLSYPCPVGIFHFK
nr:uncharacterized protein LOC106689482 [Halyomorpha halys]